MAPVSGTQPAASADDEEYAVPVIHTRVPASVRDGAFWACVGIALAEVIDPPVATLIVIGFLVAGRRRRSATAGQGG